MALGMRRDLYPRPMLPGRTGVVISPQRPWLEGQGERIMRVMRMGLLAGAATFMSRPLEAKAEFSEWIQWYPKPGGGYCFPQWCNFLAQICCKIIVVE